MRFTSLLRLEIARHPGGQSPHVTVISAAATAEDAQAEVFVDLPHLGGEALGVVFGVV